MLSFNPTNKMDLLLNGIQTKPKKQATTSFSKKGGGKTISEDCIQRKRIKNTEISWLKVMLLKEKKCGTLQWLPWVGKKFTRTRAGGGAISRLDKALGMLTIIIHIHSCERKPNGRILGKKMHKTRIAANTIPILGGCKRIKWVGQRSGK